MTGVNGGPTPHTLEDWMRRMEKRVLNQERRPIPHRAADLLGPGIASRCVELMDWSGESTLFNGFFFSAPGALNSPDTTKHWIGFSMATAEGYGQQLVWEYRDNVNTYPYEWTRTFAAGSSNRSFTPWVSPTFDTGWNEFSAASGWTKTVARWRRIGSLLSLEVSVTNNNSIAVSAGGSIANQSLTNAIPAAVWPRMHVNGMLAIGAGGGLGMGYVSSTSGQVGVASADATGTARTIPADNPYVGTFTWMI